MTEYRCIPPSIISSNTISITDSCIWGHSPFFHLLFKIDHASWISPATARPSIEPEEMGAGNKFDNVKLFSDLPEGVAIRNMQGEVIDVPDAISNLNNSISKCTGA
ncbi:hypothetical protein KSP40_PGU008587 [Platanthera guangdongensis]|uniref:Uncharacterized protein n=1 Tax=Platanthera guangdongensis TaxID=2320717 RepID=A0ABR2N169_9ASPA